MSIDEKLAALWTEEDLQEVCDRQRRETQRLEFKRELNLNSDSQKQEAERDAQGMANGGGGHIIYGIAEAALADGTTAASELTPLADGSLYDRLNHVLDSRGDPRLPYEIHSIAADAGGSYLVVEVFGHRRPHRSSNGRYYVRRNASVRPMTEAEVAEAYRERFTREAAALGLLEQEQAPERADEARQEQRDMLAGVFRLYRAETGAERNPGWLSVLAIPTEAEGTLIDPLRIEPVQLHELSATLEDRWRPEEAPLTHFRLQRTTRGFFGQIPDRDDTYPRYLVRFWRSGVAEFGDSLEPMFPDEGQGRTIPSAAIVEYTHDFLLLAQQVYRLVGYRGLVEAEAWLENISGYSLAVRPGADLPNMHPIQEDILAPEPWQGPADELDQGAVSVARDLVEVAYLAANAGRPPFFDNGRYARPR